MSRLGIGRVIVRTIENKVLILILMDVPFRDESAFAEVVGFSVLILILMDVPFRENGTFPEA